MDEQMNQEKTNKLQWFFFVIVVPVIFAITLGIIISMIFGYDLAGKAESIANKVPGISKLVSTDVEEQHQNEIRQYEEAVAQGEKKISQLEEEVSAKDSAIEDLQSQIAELEADLVASEELPVEEEVDRVAELATSFSSMDPEEAAPIIESMDKDLAIQVLEKLPSENRGEILAQVDPEVAADLVSTFLSEA